MELDDGDLIFFGRESFDCKSCKRQLVHCAICCGTCSEYTHVGIIKIKDGEIFVYESSRHHHGFDAQGVPVHEEGVQERKLSYYKDYYNNCEMYVRKRIGRWNVELNKDEYSEGKYRKGYNCCMWDWCRALFKCRSCCRWSKKTFCSEYVASELGLEDPDLMTPKDLAENPEIPYEVIKGPISKVTPAVFNPTRTVNFKF